MDRDIRSRREKVESKGGYAYDLHKAIRAVNRAQQNGDLEKVGLCLEALRDICAPEIREAVNEEWVRIDDRYRDTLERVQNAEFEAKGGRSGFEKNPYGSGEVYYVNIDVHAPPEDKERIEENARNRILRNIWNEIFHARLQACIDCLDDHGVLRDFREVEYGRI